MAPRDGTIELDLHWTPTVAGSFNIKSRAADDSLNLETPAAGVNVTVGSGGGGSGTYSLWSASTTPAIVTDPDSSPIELGVKFVPGQAGQITGIRFYKGPQNLGTHVGNLWNSTGTQLLGTATFTNETASGWQQVNFANPVSVTAGTTYVASYFAPQAKYSVNENYFNAAYTNGPLTAPATGTSGGNGVYRYNSYERFSDLDVCRFQLLGGCGVPDRSGQSESGCERRYRHHQRRHAVDGAESRP